jgi:hypothetical protein
VDGKKILGQYPRDLDDSGSDIFQPGIAIPTTPWDAVWNGISRWLGINNSADLDEVIPNRGTFSNLFGEQELFKTDDSKISSSDSFCLCSHFTNIIVAIIIAALGTI